MGTKIKYAAYVLVAAILFVPIAFMGGAEAEVTCYTVSGTSVDNDNTGAITPNLVCADASGVLTGSFESDNIGTIYLDHDHPAYENASFDLDTGYWTGYAYAPLNDYDYPYSYGAAFDLSNVYTDMSDGSIDGWAYSSSLGGMYFEGLTQELSPVYLTASVSYEVFGSMVDGVPVADNESGYRVLVKVSSYDGSYELDSDNFSLSGSVNGAGNMCFDQVDGTCGDTEALSESSDFKFYTAADGSLTYYYNVKSYAPTSDALCSHLGTYEYCLSPDTINSYGVSNVTVTGVLGRDFVWYYGGSEYEDTVTVSSVRTMSFASAFEVDNFYPIDVDLDTLTNVSEGESYDFEPAFVRNGEYYSGQSVEVYYTVDDTNFSFGDVVSGDTEFVVSDPSVGSLAGEDAFTDISLWTDSGDSLTTGAVATATTYISAHIDGKAVYYPSQYFFFADLMAGIADPRVGVIGTVSGLASGDDVTVVGDVNRLELRDVVFEQVMKVIRGISDSVGSGGTVYDDWTVSSQGESLVSDSVLYFTGNGGDIVTVEGGEIDDIVKTILVVGADVYIEGDIYRTGEDGELGIIVLSDNGNGGNIYIDDSVTDLHANIFIDGNVRRADSSGASYDSSVLTDQLYIWGSIISQNTIGGVDDDAGPICGDGEVCSVADAELDDFGYMSYYQVCYAYSIGGDGTVTVDTGTYEECPGYSASSYEGDYDRQPVIIEYRPASSELPVFNVSGSVVR